MSGCKVARYFGRIVERNTYGQETIDTALAQLREEWLDKRLRELTPLAPYLEEKLASTRCGAVRRGTLATIHSDRRTRRRGGRSVYACTSSAMPSTTARPRHNPDARVASDVLGTSLPDTVSAVSWKRPYRYFVVRTDDDRLSRLDDHEAGRIIVSGFTTRHNAVGHKALCERYGPGEYIVGYEENDHYEG